MGLSIVRSLIEGMGGNVYYEREEDETAFVIVLPLATGDPAETQIAISPRRQAEPERKPVEVMASDELSALVET